MTMPRRSEPMEPDTRFCSTCWKSWSAISAPREGCPWCFVRAAEARREREREEDAAWREYYRTRDEQPIDDTDVESRSSFERWFAGFSSNVTH